MTLDLSHPNVVVRTISAEAAKLWADPGAWEDIILQAIGGIEGSVREAANLVHQGKAEIAYAVICITKSAGNS